MRMLYHELPFPRVYPEVEHLQRLVRLYESCGFCNVMKDCKCNGEIDYFYDECRELLNFYNNYKVFLGDLRS